MYVQIVEFETQGISPAEWEAFCEGAVPTLAGIPGLVAKLFLADAETSRRCGVYTFTGREAAEAFLAGDLYREGIVANPVIANVRTRGAELLAGPTRALDAALAPVASA